MQPASGVAVSRPGTVQGIDVDHVDVEAYEIRVRGHRIRVDQPTSLGGDDSGTRRPR